MPITQDLVRALQQRTVLPPGSVAGTRLTWNGPTDADIDWTSDPDPQIVVGNGDPNGAQFAPMGTLYVERDAPALWQNQDGDSTWTEVTGGGGGSTFPITFDDGTNTYTIDIESGHTLVIKNVLDAGSVIKTKLEFDGNGFTQFTTKNGWEVNNSTAGGVFLYQHDGGVLQLKNFGNGGVFLESDSGGGIFLDDVSSGGIYLNASGNLYLTNGAFYNKGGVGFDDYGDQSGTVGFNFAFDGANVYRVRLIGNMTATLSGATSGAACDITIYLIQDGTGSRLVTWPGSVKWASGTTPVLSTAANAVDKVFLETYDGGTTWFGNLLGKGYA